MASAHGDCSYHQVKTPIGLPRSFARRQETLPIELTGTHDLLQIRAIRENLLIFLYQLKF
jgi:hypothetical protein